MRRLTAAFIAVIALAASAVAQVEKVLPSTEANFGSLLLGCWEEGWHAQFVDGTEGEGSSVVCFQNDGKVNFTYEDHHHDRDVSAKGVGLYVLKNNKLHLNNMDSTVEWPFLQHNVHCDAVIKPGETLDLTGCAGDGTDLVVGAFSFGRSDNEVLLGCWRDPASMGVSESDADLGLYDEFCFEADDTLRVTRTLADAELSATGDYEFNGIGHRIFLYSGSSSEGGWVVGAAKYVSCLVSVASDTLQLTECLNGADYLETTFTGLRQ